MAKKDIKICVIAIAMLLCWKGMLWVTSTISLDSETGNLIVRYHRFSDYTFELYDDHVVLLSYEPNDKTTVKIPDTIMGKPVTEIGEYCFSDRLNGSSDWYDRQIETVYLGENITKIDDRAFDECYNLKAVYGDNEIAYIGEWAFSKCYSLSYFEPCVLDYAEDAFGSGCYDLKEFTTASGVVKLREDTSDTEQQTSESETVLDLDDFADDWQEVSFLMDMLHVWNVVGE